jgi:hypothetical protein
MKLLTAVLLLSAQAVLAMDNVNEQLNENDAVFLEPDKMNEKIPPTDEPKMSHFCTAAIVGSLRPELQEECDAVTDELECGRTKKREEEVCQWTNKLTCAENEVTDDKYNPLKYATRVTFSCCNLPGKENQKGQACSDECLNISPFHSMFRCKYTSVLNNFYHGATKEIMSGKSKYTAISEISAKVGDPYLHLDLTSHCTAKCPFVVVTNKPDESPYVLDKETLKAFQAKKNAADATEKRYATDATAAEDLLDTVKIPAIAFFDPKERVSPFPSAYKGYSMYGQSKLRQRNVVQSCKLFRSLAQQTIARMRSSVLAFFNIDGTFILHKKLNRQDGYSSSIIDVFLQLFAKKQVALTYDAGRPRNTGKSGTKFGDETPWNDDRSYFQWFSDGYEINKGSKIVYHTDKANQIDRSTKKLQDISMRRQVWEGK